MDEMLKRLVLGATDESLFAWTDPKMVGRAYGYLEKVEDISFVEGKGIVAKVHGTKDYFTRVFRGDGGGLESECSCPVSMRCKHAVAVILKCSRVLASGAGVAVCGEDGDLWRNAQRAFAEAGERSRQIAEKKLLMRREMEEKEAERLRREQEIVSGFIEEIQGLEEEVKRLCEERRADDIVRKAMELLAAAEDETVYRHPHDYDELFESIEQTMYEVVQALRKSGWSAADVLVWAVYLTRPYLGVHNPEVMYHLLSVPHGEYAAADTWREVAMRLQAEMDRFPKSEHGGQFSAIWHQAEEIMRAWEHAGEERNASEYLVKYVSRVMNWKEVVEFLMRHSMFDEAIRIAKEGIEASRANPNDYEYDYDDQLEDLLELLLFHLLPFLK